jgi:hypothetical protein
MAATTCEHSRPRRQSHVLVTALALKGEPPQPKQPAQGRPKIQLQALETALEKRNWREHREPRHQSIVLAGRATTAKAADGGDNVRANLARAQPTKAPHRCSHCGTHVVSILLNRLPNRCSHRRSFVGSHRESNSHADSISDGITDSDSDGESYCCSDKSHALVTALAFKRRAA